MLSVGISIMGGVALVVSCRVPYHWRPSVGFAAFRQRGTSKLAPWFAMWDETTVGDGVNCDSLVVQTVYHGM